MATTLKSWSLVAFAKAHGAMKLIPAKEYTNTQTGEVFTKAATAFVHPTKKDNKGRNLVTFVWFSKNLGELTAREIAQQKDSLQIVESSDTGTLILCKQGDAWEDVDLGL